jgi:hypothetical protein
VGDLLGGVWFAGMVGAELGAVCAPLIAWLLLRYVPLGRAFLGLTIGTVLGGLAGWYLLIENTWFAPIGGALAGCIVAGAMLRHFATRRAPRFIRLG